MLNENSLCSLCATLCEAMGIKAPVFASEPSKILSNYVKEVFCGEKADRIFMYNPDAIAEWIYKKYPHFLSEAKACSELEVPFKTVMPSVTPVCFGTMYTGAEPEIHGIKSYTKPVIAIESIFDALINAGKKPAIVSTGSDSMSKIYLERKMDYFICDSIEKANAKAMQLIIADEHDFIALYNGNYDSIMHKFGPESPEALAELKANSRIFGMIHELIKNEWGRHNTLLGFAMDHGCHEIDGGCGSHGLDMEEDLNICHLYKAIKKR